ncbi:MAG: RNA-guided endonuclease InsQ/TnpB family protein [Ktedonobacteraceae bacterium]
MRKTFKYRIYPNKQTEQKLYWTLTRCRELYNAALSERKDAYKYVGKPISYYDQQNDLPEIKAEIREEYQDIAAHVLQDVLRRLNKAFDHFFRRCKNGENPGYPRFQGRNRYDSFTYPDGAGWKLTVEEQGKKLKGTLSLTKIGQAKVTLHRKLEGKIKAVTIKREVDQWYVTFSCEVEEPEKLPTSYEDVGIDLGVTHLATLSNGKMIEHPRYYRKARKVLEKRQHALSRKKRGSHRREKARKGVSRTHRKIARQRKDFQHKASKKLVGRYQVIVFEDIKTANLTRKPKPKQDASGAYLPNGASAKGGLNKSILDAGWGTFVSMCHYKAAWAGRTLIKVSPKFTSQICSGCGQVRKKDLSERWHSCDCGTELDRDVNAAINILERGRRQQSAMAVEAPCLEAGEYFTVKRDETFEIMKNL